jgi:hypothetical protein
VIFPSRTFVKSKPIYQPRNISNSGQLTDSRILKVCYSGNKYLKILDIIIGASQVQYKFVFKGKYATELKNKAYVASMF